MAVARMRSVGLMVNQLELASRVFTKGLGLRILHADDTTTEIDAGNITITLHNATGNEAQLSTGYSPFLNFDVADMDTTVYKLMSLGARLDGPIEYPIEGKMAAIRTPDGHMLGLFEPANEDRASGNPNEI